MKTLCHLLFLVIAVITVSCSKDNIIDVPEIPEIPETVIDDNKPFFSLPAEIIECPAVPHIATNLSFSSSMDWIIENPNDKMIEIYPMSGSTGDGNISVKWLSTNLDNEDRELSFILKTRDGKVKQEIKVTQKPVVHFGKTNYIINGEGGELQIPFTCNIDYQNSMELLTDESFHTFCTFDKFDEDNGEFSAVFTIQPNNTGNVREAIILLKLDQNEDYKSSYIYITQLPAGAGESKDYSQDGKVTTLQIHSEGQGVPIIVMGDAFIDTELKNGTYEKIMRQACDKLFTQEPMTSLKPYFDIYMVNAVSPNNVVANGFNTAFKTQFKGGLSTNVFGDENICDEYALKAIRKDQLDNALILVLVNDGRHAGTCRMDIQSPKSNVCVGKSIAFVCLSPDYEKTLHHEAIGHGLGKLCDEYGSDSEIYASNGSILDSKNASRLDLFKKIQRAYAYMNVSLESAIEKTPWKEFAKDIRYSQEKIGMYEGGNTFPYGVWRSTERSLMHNGTELNAISRCLLYKRIMNIANNYQWDFDYETFVKFDEPARMAARSVAVPAKEMWCKKHSEPIINLR